MSETVVTKDNLDKALTILRQVLDEPPLTKKQRLEALLLRAEKLQEKIDQMEQEIKNDHVG